MIIDWFIICFVKNFSQNYEKFDDYVELMLNLHYTQQNYINKMYQRQPLTFDRVMRVVFVIALILGLVWIVNLLKDVLLPFLVASLIAYLFEPFVQHNLRLLHLKKRGPAVFITLFEALFFVCVIIYFVTPLITAEFHNMAQILRNYAASKMTVKFLPADLQHFLRESVDYQKVNEMLMQLDWMTIIQESLATTWDVISGGWSVVLGIVSWLIVVLYVVFIMLDYEKLGHGFRSLIPKKMQGVTLQVGHDIAQNMNRYFRGQALIAAIVGVLFAIGFSIVGIPMAIVLGLFIGVLNLVPYLQVISILPTALLCLVYAVGGGGDFWTLFLECIAVYCIVQVIQDFYLTPRIMGKAMGLNPAIILLALSVWGSLLGFIGLIIALPLTTLIISYYRHYLVEEMNKRYDADAVEGLDKIVDSGRQ